MNIKLKHPHITEKSALQTESKVYTFTVDQSANKNEVASSVRTLYKIRPVKVRMIHIPGKEKKALVYLKKGDSISFT